MINKLIISKAKVVILTAFLRMNVEAVGILGLVLRRVQIQVGGVIQFILSALGAGLQSKFSWHVKFL